MNFKDIHRPYQDGLPDRFTWPFRYCPDQAVRLAAEKVIQHIDSDEGLKAAFSEGKMLGVLVVMTGAGKADDGLLHGLDTENGIFYLAAFSGNAGGRNRISGFVPPIFDTLDPEGHFKKEEAAINAVSEEIERLEGTAALPDEDPGLPVRERIRELKEKRAEQSVRLQEWLFSQYAVRNASGETRSVLDIFADKGLVPPGGTGDCAAPRLLQYAFTHSLEPVSMGEFWYCGEDIAAGPFPLYQRVFRDDCPYDRCLSCPYLADDIYEVTRIYIHIEPVYDTVLPVENVCVPESYDRCPFFHFFPIRIDTQK